MAPSPPCSRLRAWPDCPYCDAASPLEYDPILRAWVCQTCARQTVLPEDGDPSQTPLLALSPDGRWMRVYGD